MDQHRANDSVTLSSAMRIRGLMNTSAQTLLDSSPQGLAMYVQDVPHSPVIHHL